LFTFVDSGDSFACEASGGKAPPQAQPHINWLQAFQRSFWLECKPHRWAIVNPPTAGQWAALRRVQE